jgi:large subunit ribosomal protein L17
MFRNMVTALLKHERIETTPARAKELRGWVDKMISLAKRGDLHARRQALAVITEKEVVSKLFDEIGPRFADRPGGYTRITGLGPRKGDSAQMALIELIGEEEKPKKAASKKKKKKKPKKEKAGEE